MGFFDDKEDKDNKALAEEKKEEVPEKIKLGDEEFDPQELADLVSKGKFAKEVEEKQNTKLDRVMPEFTKATQELKQLREEKAKWEQLRIEQKPQDQLTEDEVIAQAKAQAKRLGLVTSDDLNEYVKEYVTNLYTQNDRAKELLNTCRSMEKEINGEDGRPKFRTEEILEYMKENPGLSDPSFAYKMKFEPELDKWKEQQFSQNKKRGWPTIEGSGGNREPSPVKITKDNLGDALRDVFSSKED